MKRAVVLVVVCLSLLLIGFTVGASAAPGTPAGTATPTSTANDTEANSSTTTTSTPTDTPADTADSDENDSESLTRDRIIQWAITSEDVSDERAQSVQAWFTEHRASLSERDQRIISRWLDVQVPSDEEQSQQESIDTSNLTLSGTYLGGQVEIYDEHWQGTTYEAVVCADETTRIAVTDSSNIGGGSGSGSAQISRYTIETGCEKISMVTNPTEEIATITIGFGGPRLHYNNHRLGGGPIVPGPYGGDAMQTVAILSTVTGVMGVLGIIYRTKEKLKWAVKRP
ncbi:hypothetical protein B4589_009860 [Halolamina sp. CBA1230]|uniref:hypothetical protein n=1 Tax=Halolamina sp. CBA1230 TaxID=1853690 RepID=UPI0009A1BCA7|nr:hypothetical protein [Halolamina sp. CBA1230]QKY20669.1 hypothetical protein B4589_009860 [Halolamina sp. CBA1230]